MRNGDLPFGRMRDPDPGDHVCFYRVQPLMELDAIKPRETELADANGAPYRTVTTARRAAPPARSVGQGDPASGTTTRTSNRPSNTVKAGSREELSDESRNVRLT